MANINEQQQSLIYILADHLFAACEAGENILASHYTQRNWPKGTDHAARIYGELEDISAFIKIIQSYEDEFATKITQARKWCDYLLAFDPSFRPLIGLFQSISKPLIPIEQKIRSRYDQDDFHAGDHFETYLENRHIHAIKDEEGFITSCDIDETFLIGGKLRLIEVLNLTDQFLTSLETRYSELWVSIEELNKELELETSGLGQD